MAVVNIELNHGILSIAGELSRYSIENIDTTEYINWFVHGAIKLDLRKVTKVDTAGLAWMFYLLEQANNNHCELSFCNIPEKLSNLIALSGVDGLLPIACD